MMMNNNMAKFTSPPKNNAERRRGEWLIKYIWDLHVTSKPWCQQTNSPWWKYSVTCISYVSNREKLLKHKGTLSEHFLYLPFIAWSFQTCIQYVGAAFMNPLASKLYLRCISNLVWIQKPAIMWQHLGRRLPESSC